MSSQLSNGSHLINGSESDSDDSEDQKQQKKQRQPLDGFSSSSSSSSEGEEDEVAVAAVVVVKDYEKGEDNFLDDGFPVNSDDLHLDANRVPNLAPPAH